PVLTPQASLRIARGRHELDRIADPRVGRRVVKAGAGNLGPGRGRASGHQDEPQEPPGQVSRFARHPEILSGTTTLELCAISRGAYALSGGVRWSFRDVRATYADGKRS